jgi:hypothetical protein
MGRVEKRVRPGGKGICRWTHHRAGRRREERRWAASTHEACRNARETTVHFAKLSRYNHVKNLGSCYSCRAQFQQLRKKARLITTDLCAHNLWCRSVGGRMPKNTFPILRQSSEPSTCCTCLSEREVETSTGSLQPSSLRRRS